MFARSPFPLYIVIPYNTFTDDHPPRGPTLNTLHLASKRTECAVVHYVLLGIMAVQVRIARDYFRSIVRPPLAYVGVYIIRVAWLTLLLSCINIGITLPAILCATYTKAVLCRCSAVYNSRCRCAVLELNTRRRRRRIGETSAAKKIRQGCVIDSLPVENERCSVLFFELDTFSSYRVAMIIIRIIL